MADGTSQYSIAQTAVLKRDKLEMNRVQLAYTLSAAWTGGVDTVCITTSAILTQWLILFLQTTTYIDIVLSKFFAYPQMDFLTFRRSGFASPPRSSQEMPSRD